MFRRKTSPVCIFPVLQSCDVLLVSCSDGPAATLIKMFQDQHQQREASLCLFSKSNPSSVTEVSTMSEIPRFCLWARLISISKSLRYKPVHHSFHRNVSYDPCYGESTDSLTSSSDSLMHDHKTLWCSCVKDNPPAPSTHIRSMLSGLW